MDTLKPLVRGYLSAMGYKIVDEREGLVVADRLLFGQHRDTQVVWTVPDDVDGAEFEPQLRPDIRRTYPQYPEAGGYVISPSRAGFSRDFTEELHDRRIKLLVPVQYFDTPFTLEESSGATQSAIAELRSRAHPEQRVPQPFVRGEPCGAANKEPDLFEALHACLRQRPDSSNVHIVIGQAGIGKSILFQALFGRLYDDFLHAKRAQKLRPRPIPLMPEHIRRLPALRMELLLESFLRTDVASPVKREAFEWLLVNGFAVWLLDGLDELFASDPDFFYGILDFVIRADSRAQILLTCRDSLMAAPDAFRDIEDFLSDGKTLQIYHLCPWNGRSRRSYAWIRQQGRLPADGDHEPPGVRAFVGQIEQSETMKALSAVPFYCKVFHDLFDSRELREFSDDVELIAYVIATMIEREIKKELLHVNMFQPNGLNDWLEQLAAMYVESSYTPIPRLEAEDYANMILVDTMDAESQQRVITNLLQFPLFRAGSERGLIAFTHELFAQFLASRWFRVRLPRDAGDIATRLAKRPDLERAVLMRFIAHGLNAAEDGSVRNALISGSAPADAFGPLVAILMLGRPEAPLLKGLGISWDGRSLTGLRFERRDLSGLSFRNCDLSDAAFDECDLTNARLEGALLQRTRFHRSCVRDANFGDGGRIQSVIVEGKLLESMADVREWLTRDAARVEPLPDPCPTGLQIRHLLGKFVDRLGNARRDQLEERGLVAGKRFPGAARTEDCVQALTSEGYFVGPDFRNRFRRAEGDRYAEIIAFVRDGRVSDGLGRVVAALCRRQGCLHRVQ